MERQLKVKILSVAGGGMTPITSEAPLSQKGPKKGLFALTNPRFFAQVCAGLREAVLGPFTSENAKKSPPSRGFFVQREKLPR